MITNPIEQAIDKAHESGFTLTDGAWMGSKCLCPMGCVIWAAGKGTGLYDDFRRNTLVASEILGVHVDWVSHFISGFDGVPKRTIMFNPAYADAYGMGRQLRDQHILELMENKEKRIGT